MNGAFNGVLGVDLLIEKHQRGNSEHPYGAGGYAMLFEGGQRHFGTRPERGEQRAGRLPRDRGGRRARGDARQRERPRCERDRRAGRSTSCSHRSRHRVEADGRDARGRNAEPAGRPIQRGDRRNQTTRRLPTWTASSTNLNLIMLGLCDPGGGFHRDRVGRMRPKRLPARPEAVRGCAPDRRGQARIPFRTSIPAMRSSV